MQSDRLDNPQSTGTVIPATTTEEKEILKTLRRYGNHSVKWASLWLKQIRFDIRQGWTDEAVKDIGRLRNSLNFLYEPIAQPSIGGELCQFCNKWLAPGQAVGFTEIASPYALCLACKDKYFPSGLVSADGKKRRQPGSPIFEPIVSEHVPEFVGRRCTHCDRLFGPDDIVVKHGTIGYQCAEPCTFEGADNEAR